MILRSMEVAGATPIIKRPVLIRAEGSRDRNRAQGYPTVNNLGLVESRKQREWNKSLKPPVRVCPDINIMRINRNKGKSNIINLNWPWSQMSKSHSSKGQLWILRVRWSNLSLYLAVLTMEKISIARSCLHRKILLKKYSNHFNTDEPKNKNYGLQYAQCNSHSRE